MFDADQRVTDLRKSFESRIKAGMGNAPMSQDAYGSGGGMSSAMSGRSEREAYSHFKNWVYVCVSYIAQRIAGQAVCAGEIKGVGANPERSYRRAQKDMLPKSFQQKAVAADVELLAEHDALDAMERPNALQSRNEFLYMSISNLLLTGECYWIMGQAKNPETNEAKLELWAVPTEWVIPNHEAGPYTAYSFKKPGTVGEGTPLDPETVCRTGFCNPMTLTNVWSPLHAIRQSARSDDNLQNTQEMMFARGINPNIIISMADQRGPDGKPTGTKKALTGAQRSQVIKSVRHVWSQSVSQGDPAIVDGGLIGAISKLQMTPQEMDFMGSGDVLRDRIFKAFGLNPIVVGEIQGANRASATMAEKSACANALNPIIDAISTTLTNRVGPLYETPQRLLLWVDPCNPTDPELDIRRWDTAMKHKAAGSNEMRRELLGLPAREEEVERNELLSTVGGMQGSVLIIQQVAEGSMSPEAATNALMLFLEIDEETAKGLVGDTKQGSAPKPPGGENKPPAPGAGDEEPDIDGDAEDEVNDAVRAFSGIMYDTLDDFEKTVLAKVKDACGQ